MATQAQPAGSARARLHGSTLAWGHQPASQAQASRPLASPSAYSRSEMPRGSRCAIGSPSDETILPPELRPRVLEASHLQGQARQEPTRRGSNAAHALQFRHRLPILPDGCPCPDAQRSSAPCPTFDRRTVSASTIPSAMVGERPSYRTAHAAPRARNRVHASTGGLRWRRLRDRRPSQLFGLIGQQSIGRPPANPWQSVAAPSTNDSAVCRP